MTTLAIVLAVVALLLAWAGRAAYREDLTDDEFKRQQVRAVILQSERDIDRIVRTGFEQMLSEARRYQSIPKPGGPE